MEVTGGSCRLGLRFVRVEWSRNTVYRVQFAATGIPGDVPEPIRQYCAGRPVDLSVFDTPTLHGDETYPRIYRAVRDIPYGRTATYGDIAEIAGTHPRVVGQAMARNPVPLVVPCHRIVAAGGIGGFSPDIAIKEELLAMERKGLRKLQLRAKTSTQRETVSSLRRYVS